MKKNIIVFGLISGLIVSAFMAVSIGMCYKSNDFDGSMIIGYAAMIVSFSFVFVGIKNYRDKFNNGMISFGRAFKLGLMITLIASTLYVITWLICYYGFIPDFMERYSGHVLEGMKDKGLSQTEMDAQLAEMNTYREMYKNPLFVILLTYMEILPVGILITLISAFILKRKSTSRETELA
jgi:amino acid transporter